MNNYIDYYKNKRIGFVGLGISNLPIIRLFAKHGINITVRDLKENACVENSDFLKEIGAEIITGENYLQNIKEDVLFLSPAIKQFLPEIVKAKKNGVYITTEMEEFFRFCPCNIIAVTGSDGKTTTTTLIAKLLEKAGKTVHLGGNIGNNLFARLDDIKADDFAVAELSSFQLMKMTKSPHIAVITNVSPNHLDWHHDMEEYTEAKKAIFLNQTEKGKTVLNASNAITLEMVSECKGSVATFGCGCGDYCIKENGIYKDGKLLLADEDILLPGEHNRQNYAAAIAAVDGLVSYKHITELAKTFGGVEHRIELVREFDDIKYYNSSIDSSPTRTAAALRSFKQKVIVIAGGYDKKLPVDLLGTVFAEKAKACVLMGDTLPRIKAVLEETSYQGIVLEAENMEDAVSKATSVAEAGDIIILSPAAASFDKYKNFMERGKHFKNIVNSL